MQIILGGKYLFCMQTFFELTQCSLDYVGAILGLVRDGHAWRLDPLKVHNLPEPEPDLH